MLLFKMSAWSVSNEETKSEQRRSTIGRLDVRAIFFRNNASLTYRSYE